MLDDERRYRNRRAIVGAVTIWVIVLCAYLLRPTGPPAMTTEIALGGALAFLLIVLGPWPSTLPGNGRNRLSASSWRTSTLVNLEILALSAFLLLLLFRM